MCPHLALSSLAHTTHSWIPRCCSRDDVGFQGFELYTLRHTCLTRWAPHMDPWTLAYLAGHRDMNITKRYVHPQEQTIRAAMDRARGVGGGHTFGHTAQNLNPVKTAAGSQPIDAEEPSGAPGETRTPDLLVRSQPLYPTELRARYGHYMPALANARPSVRNLPELCPRDMFPNPFSRSKTLARCMSPGRVGASLSALFMHLPIWFPKCKVQASITRSFHGV